MEILYLSLQRSAAVMPGSTDYLGNIDLLFELLCFSPDPYALLMYMIFYIPLRPLGFKGWHHQPQHHVSLVYLKFGSLRHNADSFMMSCISWLLVAAHWDFVA